MDKPEPLIIQLFTQENWLDVAELQFEANYHLAHLHYLRGYDVDHLEAHNCFALSLNYPVSLFAYTNEPFRFLDDIIPAGASRRYWLKRLTLEHLPVAQQNYLLLKQGAIAPIGHLRIKQAVEALPVEEIRFFDLNEVKNRAVDFLDYANQRGAMAGGATGAGGEAPKLLLRWQNDGKIWIDNPQNDQLTDQHYLVKYPRGKRSEIDCDILRAEFYYYQQLTALGFSTIDIKKMRLIEGEYYPSLWLPRFDIQRKSARIDRLAMESVYSLLEKSAGSTLDHEQTIRQLIQKIRKSGLKFDINAFVTEWIKRDLLNIAFGNSDNHGRNSAFLRDETHIWLAPIYDFAPMKADPEGIPRSTTWNSKANLPLELGGEYRFDLITQQFDDLLDSQQLMCELRQLAVNLLDLKTDLIARGVPDRIVHFPSIGLDFLADKFKRWQLI